MLRFQHVDDYLEDIFAAVLGGSRVRADAVFASVRDRKIRSSVPRQLSLQGEPLVQLLPLMNRIKGPPTYGDRSLTPNPVRHDGLVRIKVRKDGDRIVETVAVERSGRCPI